MIDLSQLNYATVAAFGEIVEFTLSSGALFLPVIYDNDQNPGDIAQVPVNADVKTLSMLLSDVQTHGIAPRGTVKVREIDYQILDIADDAGGIAILQIRSYH